MMSAVKEVNFDDATEYVPAIVTIAAMPLTFSIAHGIALWLHQLHRHQIAVGPLEGPHGRVVTLAILFVLKFALL
jgi:AGZA family xanthine/uracil permease-like MFS transporter